MKFDITYAEAVALADHLKALGDTTVYLHNDAGFPWNKVSDVEAGSSWRLNGPAGIYVIANDSGLTFRLSVDFELPGANGKSVSQFDRERLREVMRKLPTGAREKFAQMLEEKVLPEMAKRTAEWNSYLNQQADSEDCVRGLIEQARKP